MTIFKQKSRHKTEQKVIHVQEVVSRPHPPPPASNSTNKKAPSVRGASAARSTNGTPQPSARPSKTTVGDHRRPESRIRARTDSSASVGRKRKRPSPAAAAPSRLSSDDDDDDGADDGDDDWEDRLDPRRRMKQRRLQDGPVDANRRLRHPELWAGDDEEEATEVPMVHAADLASLANNCEPAMGLKPEEVKVELRYPGAKLPERYELVLANDNLQVVNEILDVVYRVSLHYLKDDQADEFLGQSSEAPGIWRQLERARNRRNGADFKSALDSYNTRLLELQRSGAVARNLDGMRGATPRDLCHQVLEQCYNRTVAPHVELLQKYEKWTSEVYGELQHGFVSDVLARTGVRSDSVLMDLGSGVGNVVLQAALETGCEAWGCELMDNPCRLAEAQRVEFAARCRLWGLRPGAFHLEKGDFRRNERVLAVIKRADVVLVNNFVFSADLNNSLVNMFLDLKPGCKVVSLKSFAHDQKNATNDVAGSIFSVEHLTYGNGCVSWSNAPGNWYISTRK